MADLSYEVVLDRHAVRGFARLPDKVKPAVWELLYGMLATNPYRAGSALLEPPLAGVHRAKRGEYVVLYLVDAEARTVRVRRIEHRRTVYGRPLPPEPRAT